MPKNNCSICGEVIETVKGKGLVYCRKCVTKPTYEELATENKMLKAKAKVLDKMKEGGLTYPEFEKIMGGVVKSYVCRELKEKVKGLDTYHVTGFILPEDRDGTPKQTRFVARHKVLKLMEGAKK